MRIPILMTAGLLVSVLSAQAQIGDALKRLGAHGSSDNSGQTASGLKEALDVGTKNTVAQTGVTNGFFGNEAIKILLPDKLRPLEKGLRFAGQGPLIDQFVLSMNRAAEGAAPAAGDIFKSAISQMSFDDARRILTGGNTAATQYFKDRTSDQLRVAFRPPVKSAMEDTGVEQKYKAMISSVPSVPFSRGPQSFDLNEYVVGKTLDGLFYVLGQEETKIRNNPAAQVTPLLREVFGGK
jgi:Protein of unknown function (DUF4197)